MKQFLQLFASHTIVAFAIYMLLMVVLAFATWDPTWIYFDSEFFEAMRWLVATTFFVTVVKFFFQLRGKADE